MTEPTEQPMGDAGLHAASPPTGRLAAGPDPSAQRPPPTGASPPGAPPPEAPRLLGNRYLLEERIATGGMASVWRAHDEILARTVAVKLLHDELARDAAFRERFRREAIAAAKLTHPNVVGVYDTGSDAGRVYLVMEFVDGLTLRDVVADVGALETGQAVAIASQVAQALEYAHRRGLVHRDVKPANILLGGDGCVKIADFGIAKAEEESVHLTRTGTVLGTAAYVAPEQIRGQSIDGRADQYALACVLYESLSGRPPFAGGSPVDVARRRLEQDPLPLRSLRATIPRGLDAVVLRALARRPEDRFDTVGQFAEALLPYADADAGRTASLALVPLAPRRAAPGGGDGDDGAAAVEPSAAAGAPSFLGTEGRWIAPVVALLALAAVLVGVALARGALDPSSLPLLAREADGGDVTDERPDAPLAPVALHAFDPPDAGRLPGGDGRENNDELPLVIDGNDATFWRTDIYDRPAFGNLKSGVGFYADLGKAHTVTSVTLRTTTPGIGIEIRGADRPAPTLAGWEVLGGGEAVDEIVLIGVANPRPVRYVLVWITGELQPYRGRYAATVAEMAIRGAAG